MYDRKIYDNKRAKQQYEKFQQRRADLLIKLGNVCYLCNADAIKGFHLHHLEYDEVESNYPRHSKSMSVRIKRLEEAENNPERFKLLCPKCHRILSGIETLVTDVNITKLFSLLKISGEDFNKILGKIV